MPSHWRRTTTLWTYITVPQCWRKRQMLISACRPVRPRALTGKQSKQMMNRASRNKPPQSLSVTQDPCQTSAQVAYFLQHRQTLAAERLLWQTSHSLYLHRDRQAKLWKRVHSRKVELCCTYTTEYRNLTPRFAKQKGFQRRQKAWLLLALFFSFRDVNYFPPWMIQLAEFNSSCECYKFYTF